MSFIGSSSKFINCYAGNPDVIMNSLPLNIGNQKFKIIDIYVRGRNRELTYALNSDLHLNVRNACTVIETNEEILWGRKSLPYFFEYKLEYFGDRFTK